MNPILSDMYSTVIPSAPFIIAAYAIVWAALLVYVIHVVRGLQKAEKQLSILEEELVLDRQGISVSRYSGNSGSVPTRAASAGDTEPGSST